MALSADNLMELNETARSIRLGIVRAAHNLGPERRGHPGPALSIADILTVLYFHTMRVRPDEPRWPDRDRLVLSKGHACIGLYAALAERGYFPKEELLTLRRVGSRLQGHPDMTKTPGVDMTTGSLGHGIAAGVGLALAGRLDGKPYRVFVIVGDGEMQEGLIWEAALAGSKYVLDSLTVVVDCNGLQSCGSVKDTMPLDPLDRKLESFGWEVIRVDGHDIEALARAFDAPRSCGMPRAVLAATIKGKGVSYMERDNSWHQRAPDAAELAQAERELLGRAPM